MTPTDIRDTAIPEDVMLTAMKVANTVLRNLDQDDVTYEVKAIARAIMAATEAERERCAKIAEQDERTELARFTGHIPVWLHHGRRIAAAIRAGTKGAK